VTRTRMSVVIVMTGLVVSAAWLPGVALRYAQAQQPKASPSKAVPHGDHEHPAVPAAYANAHIPTRVWRTPR